MTVAATSSAVVKGATASSFLPVRRSENFGEWYQSILKEGDLAESSAVRGCMVIKKWGYGIWEQIQRQMDDAFQSQKCCDNYYFPLFIPTKFFEAEATHVAGFAKECAVVTHYRMTVDKQGKMIPDPEAKLAEPLIVRPTSETIIGDSMRQWVQSYHDLPLKINQWCNVVRWEHHTRPFLRTTEFLWQEGHCAFATEQEGRANALQMAQVYQAFMTQVCAMPTILGEKSPGERFAGADQTYCLEAMMQDGKAVQAGTSHYLGEHFSRAAEIQFDNPSGEKEFAKTTSWGVSTRLIGAMLMVHSDDKGVRLPPRIVKHHVVILPSGKDTPERNAYINAIETLFQNVRYEDRKVSVHVDDRFGKNAGEKKWDWLRKGVPVCFEVGPKEAKGQTVSLLRRDEDLETPYSIGMDSIVAKTLKTLSEIQATYFEQASAFLKSHVRTDITTAEELREFFSDPTNIGFVRAKWCGDQDTEEAFKDLAVTIRCLPLEQTGTEGTCIITGKPATVDAIFGKSY